jgi:hypothetical protein
MSLLDAALCLDDLAAGHEPDHTRLLAGARSLEMWCQKVDADRDLLDAAAGLTKAFTSKAS